jgi:Spy/CpxP family protein refolding chaperone
MPVVAASHGVAIADGNCTAELKSIAVFRPPLFGKPATHTPMKTITPGSRLLALNATLFLLTALAAPAKDQDAKQPQVSSRESEMVVETLAETPDSWNNIKNLSYEKRTEFTAVFTRMTSKLDDEIRALNAKRESMTNDTRNWDFAMKELNNARADVQSKFSELSRATTDETWADAKEKLGTAWDRAQLAVRNVKTSTTS